MSATTPTAIRLDGMADHPEAERAAAQVVEECWDGRLPIDPVRIAKSFGLKTFNDELDDNVSGMLVKRKGSDPEILLNRDDSRNRRRFTVAHELGHYVRRSEQPDEYEYVDYRDERSSTGTDDEERFANGFAANLLMPREAVESLVEEGTPDFLLAKRFGVSREAIQHRLDNLGLL
jgi:Zn-dependent peptidase ImmA (M78 family)